MIPRHKLRFPAILFQFLDCYFDQEGDRHRLNQMLDYLSVSEDQFRDPNYCFDGEQLFLMLELLRKGSVYEPASLRILRYLSINNLGMAGIAGLTGNNLNDAIELVMKFHKAFFPAAEFMLESDGGKARFQADLITDFEACNPIVIEIIFGALKLFADEVTGESLDVKIEFAHSPSWGANREQTIAIYKDFFKCDVEFDAPGSSVLYRSEYIEKQLKNRNRIMHRFARVDLDKSLKKSKRPSAVSEKARRMIEDLMTSQVPLSLEHLASLMQMSPSTLSRKLAKEGAQYKTLVNEVRFERAKRLLKRPGASIKQTASLLGFSSAYGFTRAFKTYVGVSPSDWKG